MELLSHPFQQLQSESFPPHHLSSTIHHDVEMTTTEPLMVHGAAIAYSLGPASDVDGDPESNGHDNVNNSELDNDEDIHGYELPNVTSASLPIVSHTIYNVGSSSRALQDFQSYKCFRDIGYRVQISDMETKNNVSIDEWNESTKDLRLKMRFRDKEYATYVVRKWSIRMAREFKVIKSKPDQ